MWRDVDKMERIRRKDSMTVNLFVSLLKWPTFSAMEMNEVQGSMIVQEALKWREPHSLLSCLNGEHKEELSIMKRTDCSIALFVLTLRP